MASLGVRVEKNQVVELKMKTKRRMYEHIVFLACLNPLLRVGDTPEAQAGSSAVDDPERLFRRFLDDVALFCDTKPGGYTVTAVTIVNTPPEYRVASNQRTQAELTGVQKFLEKILALVLTSDRDNASVHLLREAVKHCKPRVKYYIRRVSESLKECMEKDEGSFLKYPGAKPGFEELAEYVARATEVEDHVRGFDLAAQVLIDRVHFFFRADNEAKRLLVEKTSTSRQEPSLEHPWKELRHYMGRLNAFHIASRTLVSTRQQWPELFQDFHVKCVPSHLRDETPFPYGVRDIRKMIGSMTHGDSERNRVEENVSILESTVAAYSLSANIRETCNEKPFKPVVHAEIVLLDWLQRTGPTGPTRFFGQFRYIGSSKPTCRLCHYYFHQHESGVQVRPTHSNLYYQWKLPDVFKADGPLAQEKRKDAALKVINSLRQDIFRALEDKTGMRRYHDSLTEITSSTLRRHQLLFEAQGTTSQNGAELPTASEQADFFQGLSIQSEEPSISPSAPSPKQNTRDILLDESEDEDKGGGALL